MKNIVITGGLGYIGTELCRLYSGEARFKRITVIDKKFCAERVAQLKAWGIHFVEASILEESKIRDFFNEADVVVHLAGITDVAYTKTQSNVERDNEIKEVGIQGTRNVIEWTDKKNAKIIFPSTHVVYEGFSETKENITEDTPTCPVLTYAIGKDQSEKDIRSSDRNYVILRLASVYGYSQTDTMRMGIMPNLFAKITSQEGKIKLFSGGVQIKSLVPLQDVVRCIKFMAENDSINRQTFHLAKDNTTVKGVATLCHEIGKEIGDWVELEETKDEIPNLGYTISNAKLLATGFEFRHDLKTCLKEMIEKWRDKYKVNDTRQQLERVDRGGKEFVDNRGKIVNYELTEPINLIGYIESKKGTVRANHYHPIQEQKCLLVSGQYISVIKDLSVPDAPIETRIINPGDIAIIQPNVAHTMVFTADSVFLNLVRGEREHKNYGITHTIPYVLVDEEMRVKLLETAKTSCRSCKNVHLERVISLGESPLANNLKNSYAEKEDKYPLEMNRCPKCNNCQLSVVVPPEKMFDNYLYVSSTSSTFRKHFEDAADKYTKEFGLNSNSFVVDIGSNDGIALKPLREKGIKILGIEPAKNVAKIANDNGIETINSYMNMGTEESITYKYGKADLVTASNVFAHGDDLREIAFCAFGMLKPNGSFIVEVQYLADTMMDLTFDNIYHEHTNYWSVLSITEFFKNLRIGAYVYKVEHIDTHGGSIRVYAKVNKECLPLNIDPSVQEFIDKEKRMQMDTSVIYKKFAENVEQVKKTVVSNFKKLRDKYSLIAAYGSPAKATTALNYFGIDNSYISYTIEDNTLKHGKIIPGVNIPIKDKEYAKANLPNVIVVLAWNFFDSIVANNQELVNKGVRFINIKELQSPAFVA